MVSEDLMDILDLLRLEETKLQRQLKGIEGAITALNGAHQSTTRAQVVPHKAVSHKRTMSAATRAKISKATKARWAKYRADKAKKSKKHS
jgi:hypothetical protein